MNNQLKSVMRYVLPSIGSMLVAYLYVVIDGIFVGQGIGADALAAVNVGSPSVSFMTALVGMMATGSAAVAAVRLGRGDYNGANDAFMTGLSLVTLVSVLAIAVFGFFAEPIARLSGSNDTLLSMAGDYIRYYNMFAPLSALAAFFSVFVRNDGNPRLSFWGMIAGGVANTFSTGFSFFRSIWEYGAQPSHQDWDRVLLFSFYLPILSKSRRSAYSSFSSVRYAGRQSAETWAARFYSAHWCRHKQPVLQLSHVAVGRRVGTLGTRNRRLYFHTGHRYLHRCIGWNTASYRTWLWETWTRRCCLFLSRRHGIECCAVCIVLPCAVAFW